MAGDRSHPPLVLGWAGSPRRGGNTDLLLEWFLAGARSAGAAAETLVLNDLKIRPCQACDACFADGVCIQRDDMEQVYEATRRAQGLVIASPIHFGGLAAQVKLAVDRLQCAWAARYRLGRPWIGREEGRRGFLITAGAMPNGERFALNAEETIKILFSVLHFEYAGRLSAPGLEERGAVKTQLHTRQRAVEAGAVFATSLGAVTDPG